MCLYLFYGYRSCVRIITSERAGMGKSLFVKRLKEDLQRKTNSDSECLKVIPIHGPLVTADLIVEALKEDFNNEKPTIFHFDIAPSVSSFQCHCYVLAFLYKC